MFITLTKRNLVTIFFAVVLVFIFLMQFLSVGADSIDISTNEKRLQYLLTIGIKPISDNAANKEITIPQEFSDVYKEYNTLQLDAGFDLGDYKGKKAVVYTYDLGEDRSANLIVFKGKLIGGDICSNKIDGEMLPLKKG